MPGNDDKRHWLKINRAPVLTLWAAIVAERMGFNKDEALTLGRAVSGLNAYSKGRRLGLFEPSKDKVREKRRKAAKEETFRVDLLGRAVPACRSDEGLRATKNGKPVSPDSVSRYLENKFGDALDDTREAMKRLTSAYPPAELNEKAYDLYTAFRPDVSSGKKGWGQEGRLSLDRIRKLADDASS